MGIVFGILAILVCGAIAIAAVGPNKLIDGIEGLLAYAGTKSHQALADYVDIENVDLGDEYTFTVKDGSLLTIIRHEGSLQLVGKEEFEAADYALNSALAAYLKSGGHAVQTVFVCDPDLAERTLREAQAPMRATAARLDLDVDDMFEEEIQHMAKNSAAETCYIALYTRPSSLSRSEIADEQKTKKELFKAASMPRAADAPNLFRAVRGLRTRHAAFVDAFLADLRQQHMACRKLEVHEACHAIRSAIDPDWTDEAWSPCLIGDPIPNRDIRRDQNDVSGHLWPSVAHQLAPRNATEINARHVQIGGRAYAPMFVHLAPQDIQVFQKLFARTAETGLPWRISFLVESGRTGLWDFKNLAAMIFKWSNRTNAQIQRAIESVRVAERDEGRTRVRLRIDLATWATAGDRRLLEQRASQLARAVEGWGRPEVLEISGDPVQGLLASGPGATLNSVATPALALLDDVTHFLPLYRPASPWTHGAIQFRSPDGKIWSFQPNSPVQSSWINLIYAEPRSGKSVLANKINLALCLSPGLTRLPLIAIIDVGRASAGLISLLQHGLPESKRHQVVSIRMRNTYEYAINPFDTQLGSRVPLAHESAFLLNLLLTLLTPHGREYADPGMSPLCKAAIEQAYRHYSEEGRPKLYSPNIEGAEAVDKAVSRYALRLDENTTWWEIVDALFDQGATHEATLAQRFAVPTLDDIAVVSQSPQFQDLYGEKKTEDGTESLLRAFVRMLSEAVRAYPVLSRPTRFDLGEARVVSIDLDDVAKSGSAAADHQTAVFYMLARYITARNFYLHEDYLGDFERKYRDYHARRIESIRQDKKHLQFDEFHRTRKIRAVREQVVADMREGGKAGVMVTLISQSISDFDTDMLGFASCKIVLSRANELTVSEMRKTFGITPTLEHYIKNVIRPPGPKGSTFVGMWDTKEGPCAQVLNSTMGGIQLWAFSTSLEDTLVRDALYRELGPKSARQHLARLYPGGSVDKEIERRKREMGSGDSEGVINALIAEILEKTRGAPTARAA